MLRVFCVTVISLCLAGARPSRTWGPVAAAADWADIDTTSTVLGRRNVEEPLAEFGIEAARIFTVSNCIVRNLYVYVCACVRVRARVN